MSPRMWIYTYLKDVNCFGSIQNSIKINLLMYIQRNHPKFYVTQTQNLYTMNRLNEYILQMHIFRWHSIYFSIFNINFMSETEKKNILEQWRPSTNWINTNVIRKYVITFFFFELDEFQAAKFCIEIERDRDTKRRQHRITCKKRT